MRAIKKRINIPVFFYELIFSPAVAVKKIIKEKENYFIGISLLTLFISIIFKILATAIILKKRSIIELLFGVGAIPYLGNFFGNIFLLVSLWFFFAFFIFHKSKIKNLKNKNYPLILFKLISLSYFPLFFLPALALLSLIINFNNPDTLYIMFSLFIKLWVALIQINIIKLLFNFKTFSAVVLYIIPVIIYYAFIFFKIINLMINFTIKFI